MVWVLHQRVRMIGFLAQFASFFSQGGQNPPTFVAHTAFADGNTTSATPDFSAIPAGPQKNDILLVWTNVVGVGGAGASAPSGEGWSSIATVSDGGGQNSILTCFWKRWGVAGNTDDSTPTFTTSSGSMSAVGQLWRGCLYSASPIENSGTAHGTGTTTPVSASGVSSAGYRRSAAVGFGCAGTAMNISGMSGSGWSDDYKGASYATTAGPDRCSAGAYNQNVGVGAPDQVTATATANVTWTAITVILKPA